jgi:hypothetical protein
VTVAVVRRHWLLLAVVMGALAASAASFGQAPTQIRVPLVLAFALVGPGAAVVPILGLRDPLGEFSLALGVSLAADVVVASALLYAHAWSPQGGLAILVALTLAGAAGQVAAECRRV